MSLGKRNITKRTLQNRTCGTIRCVDEKYEGTNNRRVEKRKDCDFCECTMISTHVSKEKKHFKNTIYSSFRQNPFVGLKFSQPKKDKILMSPNRQIKFDGMFKILF